MSELETTSSSETGSSGSESSAATSSPAQTGAGAASAGGVSAPSQAAAGVTDPSSVGAPVVPAYTPNYKFKVMDKEHEIPEFLRGAVKEEKHEKELREIFEKAYGLDVVKPKYQSTKAQYDRIVQEKTSQDRSIEILGKFIQNDDLDSFFKAIKIPEEQILKYALDRVNYRNLPPDQRMQVDAQLSERQRLTNLEYQNQMLQQQFMEGSVQARTIQLDTTLARPDIKSMAETYDARVGRPGAFKSEVIKRGQYANYSTGADISVEQAVSEVLQQFSPFLQSVASAPGATGQVGAVAPPAAPPVIPNVAGRATSPARRVPRSIADLKELANSL